MHVEGTFTTRAPAERVWALFRDPVAFTNCLDDPHAIHAVDATHFEGTVTTGVAFIRGTFRVRGSYVAETALAALEVKLSGTGMGSGLDADVKLTLETAGATTVRWSAEITLNGPVATIGERVVRGTVDKKTAALFAKAQALLEAPP